MAKLFGVVRGSFFIEDKEVSPSIISIDELDLPTEGALVSTFTVSDMEKSTITQCFNNVNHIYAFGHDPEQSGFSITYLVFLGEACMEDEKGFRDSGNLARVVKSYNDLKVSVSKASVDVTLGTGLTVVGIILSANVAVYDAEMNAVTVTIAGKSLITGK